MIESRKFVAAAILFGLALIMAGLMLTPSNGARAAASSNTDIAAERIGAAFASLPDATPSAAIAAAAKRVMKGDLALSADCTGAAWPNIDATCLATADGHPAPRVRTITIGYQSGEATTVLVRIPAAEVAQR